MHGGTSASHTYRGTSAQSPVKKAPRPVLRVVAVLGALAIAFHVAHGQLGLGGKRLDSFTEDWLYDAIVAGAAVSCLARAWLIRAERLAWLLLGIGLAFNGAGEIYYSVAFGDSGNPPIPSLADLLYLLYYPCAYAALVLLVRARLHSVPAAPCRRRSSCSSLSSRARPRPYS